MGADNSVAEKVDAPPLTPLQVKTRLAGTPEGAPKYAVSVKNAAGEDGGASTFSATELSAPISSSSVLTRF